MTDLPSSPTPEHSATAAPDFSRAVITLVLIWLGWAFLLIGFQALVDWRYQPERPDHAVMWSASETMADSQEGKPYLLESFMNHQVSWDSEYYLSIAVGGYEDPAMRRIDVIDRGVRDKVSQNYAFFPLYPLVMQALSVPLGVLGMTPIATATLAGVLISLLGTLAGMIALYDLTRDTLGHEGGLRTAFYLLIFPTSFFLAQVYTEGLFVGLAFGSLALMRRGHLIPAAVLAALATWTRSVGVALIVPLALAWLQTVDWRSAFAASPVLGIVHNPGREVAAHNPRRERVLPLLLGAAVFLPLLAFLIWQRTIGHAFDLIQTTWFGREMFNWGGMQWGLDLMLGSFRDPAANTQMTVYYALEVVAVLLALVACLLMLRRYPGLALFGLAVLVVSVTSGAPQSLIRYVLAVPALFVFLSHLGRHAAFDRAWTVASLLLMAMQASLFTWDMWVA